MRSIQICIENQPIFNLGSTGFFSKMCLQSVRLLLPWQAHDENGRHHNLQTTLEQRAQHAKCQIHVPWHQFFYLSAPLNRYEYMQFAFAFSPLWIVEQYQLKDKVQDGHIFWGNALHCMGSPTCRHLSQQALMETPGPARIFRMQTNPWPLEAHVTPHLLHPCDWQFWREIWVKRRYWTPHQEHQTKIWTYGRLGWRLILQHSHQMGLHCTHPWHINAGIHHQKIANIQVCFPNQATTLPALPPTQTIWQQGATPPPPGHIPSPLKRRHQTRPTHHWEHPVLHPGCWPHSTKRWAQSQASKQRAPKIPCWRQNNSSIIWPCIPTQLCNSTPPTWFSISTQMHHIYLRQMPTAERADTSLWVVKLTPKKPSDWMGHFLCCVQFYVSSSPPPWKQNLACSSSIALQTGHHLLTYARRNGTPTTPTIVHCNNSTAIGIANNTIKRQRSGSMEMSFFGLQMQLNKGNST